MKKRINNLIMKKRIDNLIKQKSGCIEPEPEHRLDEHFQFDSLDSVKLIMELENEFSILIPDSKAKKVKTVQDVYDLINKLTK